MIDRNRAQETIAQILRSLKRAGALDNDAWINIICGREGVRLYMLAGKRISAKHAKMLADVDALFAEHAKRAWKAINQPHLTLGDDPESYYSLLRELAEEEASE